MEEVTLSTTKQKQRKKHEKKKETLAESVPDAPKLEDFVFDTKKEVPETARTMVLCSEQPGSIEHELLDAVRDVDALKQVVEEQAEQEEERCTTENRDVSQDNEKINDIAPVDAAGVYTNNQDVTINVQETESLSTNQSGENVLIRTSGDRETSGETELQEICVSVESKLCVSDVEADTKFESPKRSCDKQVVEDYAALRNLLASETLIETEKSRETVLDISKPKISTKNSKVSKFASERTGIRPFTEPQLSSLYRNEELEMCHDFISEFIESNLRSCKQHYLYELLTSYLRARNKLASHSLDLESLKKECKENQKLLWTIETTMITESGECQDGNPVSASHEHRTSHFSDANLSALSRRLNAIRELMSDVYALNAYSSEVLRLQVEHYIQTVLTSCSEFSCLPHNAPVALVMASPPLHFLSHIRELRECISIFFMFQRRLIKDSQFISDTRDWLSRSVAVLLRVATWKDHLFLLNHVLRCPAGIASWATTFIQIPAPPAFSRLDAFPVTPFSNANLNHLIATLATLLLPVKEREQFLEQVQIHDDSGNESLWVLVDSDGEEDDDAIKSSWSLLRENDLVALLNQLPIDAMFRHVLLISRRDDRDVYDAGLVTENHMLRLFAFSTVLVRLLRQGLKTYDSPRYRQFAKRLGRLIRHTVQYASDHWQCFKTLNTVTDPAMLQRLQVEYDAFFLRATECIFSSQRLGAWQFLAVIPYGMVSVSTMWQLFFILHHESQEEESLLEDVGVHRDWEELLSSLELRQQFEEKLMSMPDAESFYLLTTFANMAMARMEADCDFIRAATLDLFQIGFLSAATRDSCTKSARVLLSDITTKHPWLISDILAKLKENFSLAGKLSIYLFKELPLQLWVPSSGDLSIISHWLLHFALTTPENNLARLILSSLNWGCNESSLCLDPLIHRIVALLVVEAATKFIPEALLSGGSTAALTEGVKQVSNYASSIVRQQSPEQLFSQWVWETVARLRLHIMDQANHVVWTAMANTAEAFRDVPDMDVNAELEVLLKGVKDKQPIACYVAVMMTTWGHSIPLICSKGFVQLQVLLCHYKYEACLEALHRIVPLFLPCEDSLLNSDRFLSLLITLVTADRTYVKMAKNLIAPEYPGPVLKQFGHMIEAHLEDCHRYSLLNPRSFIRLWILCLSQIPDWYKDPGVIYLVDILLRSAFFYCDAKEVTTDLLVKLREKALGPRHGGSISSFISWVATGSGNVVSLLCRASSPECPWFAYHVLEMEQEWLEERTGLWRALLQELASSAGKANIDQALKKAAQALKLPVCSSASLAIYRWAQQALDTPVDHPLVPLLWQKFFMLYLSRVPSLSLSGGTDKGGVGDKFFEGMVNLSFHKKLKKRLQDTAEFYRTRSVEPGDFPDAEEMRESHVDAEAQNTEKKQFYEKCARLMRTFSLWLEEPRLHEPTLFLPALPPQYDSKKLAAILQGDKTPWLEYLDYSKVRELQQKAFSEWNVCHFRTQVSGAKVIVSPGAEDDTDPRERILKRLQSYDTPEAAPPIRPIKSVMPHVNQESLSNRDEVLELMKPSFRSLMEYAQIFSLRSSEHTALDCSFLELVPVLYRDVEMEVVLHAACDSEPHVPGKHSEMCAGPAAISIKVSDAQLNEGTKHMMDQNRQEYEAILQRALQPPPQKVCSGSVFLEHIITLIEKQYEESKKQGDISKSVNLQESGVSLFYYVISQYKDETSFYPPTKQLLTTCVERLGRLFVSGDESQCVRLLSTIIQQPQLAGILGPHLTPASATTHTFLQMYTIVVDNVDTQAPEMSFVLVSKFNITRWLSANRPRLSERSQFIRLIARALTKAGLTPDEDKLMVYEVFRKHLRLMLLHDFPEHYGEILNILLESSESQCLAVDVWFDLLNVLASGKEPNQRRFRQGLNPGKLKDEIRRYATEQKLLALEELRDTAALLGNHFMKERLQHGLYGLYPKYRVYIEPLTVFASMLGHALVVGTVQRGCGALSDKLCEQLWPSLSCMFTPWISPYMTKNLKEPVASWIQQLTDDRTILLPWIVADGPYATKMVLTFTECVRFILDTLPACSNILCFLWQYYVSNFAHTAVKDHVLNVFHANVLTLPWEKFWPSIQDVENMLKVVEQYLPDCHSFLGTIFIEVGWWRWVGHVGTTYPTPVTARMHYCLLHLVVKLANEPSVRQSNKITPLLLEAQKFSWHLLDSQSYDQVVNWWVMSCDPRVILILDEENNPVDVYIIELLQVVAAYIPTVSNFHQTTLTKRQLFVRACVKLLLSVASRYKVLLTKKELAFHGAIRKLLDDLETVVTSTVPPLQQVPEASLLLIEILGAVNQPAGNSISQMMVTCCVKWLSTRDCMSVTLQSFLRILGTTVKSPEHFGTLLEAALQAFFRQTVTQSHVPEWQQVSAVLQPNVPRQPPMEDSLLANGQILSLYALILKRLPTCRDITEEGQVLSSLVDWLTIIKITEETEPKIPLLWGKILTLSFRQCEYSGDSELAARSLRILTQHLEQLAEDKSSWGILGAIGLKKQSPVSKKCRLLCRALSVYVTAQLPDGEQQTGIRTTPNAPGGITILSADDRSVSESASLLSSPKVHKAVNSLEALGNTKQYAEYKTFLDLAVKQVLDANNSLHNAAQVLGMLVTHMYQQQYLLVLKG